jgi:hypothetical protein
MPIGESDPLSIDLQLALYVCYELHYRGFAGVDPGWEWDASLLHLRGDCYVYAALAVVPGNAHECPVLYESVEQFVKQVGKGVIKLLLLDRGFVDGKNITRCKREWGIDVLLPMKRKMDIWEDAWALGKRCPWQELAAPPTPPSKPLPAHRPEAILRRELKRQKTVAANKAKEPPPDPATVLVARALSIQGFSSWSACGVPIKFADGKPTPISTG